MRDDEIRTYLDEVEGLCFVMNGTTYAVTKPVREYRSHNHPYGSSHTEAKWEIECKGGRQRIVRTTKNPKTGNWSRPRVETFTDYCAFYVSLGGTRVFPVTVNDDSYKLVTVYRFDLYQLVYDCVGRQMSPPYDNVTKRAALLRVYNEVVGLWTNE